MEPDTSRTPTKRKFFPDLVETSSRSSAAPSKQHAKDKSVSDKLQAPSSSPVPSPASSSPRTQSPKRAVRFSPQVVETTSKVHGGNEKKRSSETRTGGRYDQDVGTKTASPAGAAQLQNVDRQKFSPQLVETGKRSFRQDDVLYPGQQYHDHVKSPNKKFPPYSPAMESRYSYASLLRRRHEGTRRHSFRVPELPAIPCSSSGESSQSPETSSHSTSPTVLSDEDLRHRSAKTSHRDSCYEPFGSPLFRDLVSARSAEKLLRDQALAAFPNEQVHQPVSHFATDKEDGESPEEDEDEMLDPRIDLYTFRRGSTVDLAWELDEMRRHKEDAQLRERDRRFPAGQSPFSAAALAAKRMMNGLEGADGHAHDMIGGWQKDVNLAQMRRPASPPMLGDDITFVRCHSPQSMMCEAGSEGCAGHDGGAESKQDACLWTADNAAGKNANGGLWNGTCKRPCDAKEQGDQGGQSTPLPNARLGIVTPAVHGEEKPLPLRTKRKAPPLHQPIPSHLPTTPSDAKQSTLENMDQMLALEEGVQREFHDGFVTHIYNYLSLGYPCLARDFDEELSKISNISIEDLRKDDQSTDAKGYVGPPKGFGTRDNTVEKGQHMRWSALKLYIHEWARQQPKMAGPENSLDTWGASARRGSWGF